MKELIRALRCSNSTEHVDCIKEKCKYFYREPQETIDKFREEHGGKFREFPDDIFETCDYEQIVLDAADELEKLCEDREKYSWHDLRKNPDDLPEKIATDYLTLSMNGTYIVRTYEGIAIKGFLDSYGHDLRTHQREEMQVIAWREIEPVESEELK